MASRNIDVNRGVTIWRYPKGGMDVFMYKDTPGYYYDSHGREVPEKIAKGAGAPVEKYRKRRMIQEEQIKVAEALRDKYDLDTPEVIHQVEDLQLIELPGGMMRVARLVEDDHGKQTTEHITEPIAPEFAREIFEDLSGVSLSEQNEGEVIKHGEEPEA